MEGTGFELSVPSERGGRSVARHGSARLHRGIESPPNLPSAVFADVTKFNDTRRGGSVAIWPARGTHSVIPRNHHSPIAAMWADNSLWRYRPVV